uniref:Secreted protein n=1 Tax=Micrurus spixii TaxID=129469 RepID=A0A2D4N7V3_9SAUR
MPGLIWLIWLARRVSPSSPLHVHPSRSSMLSGREGPSHMECTHLRSRVYDSCAPLLSSKQAQGWTFKTKCNKISTMEQSALKNKELLNVCRCISRKEMACQDC